MDGKSLGKIQSIDIKVQDGRLGLFTTLTGEYGVQDTVWTWDYETAPHDENCQWSKAELNGATIKIMKRISELLKDAKVSSLDKLKDKPIEMEFEGRLLKSWRILTEVL